MDMFIIQMCAIFSDLLIWDFKVQFACDLILIWVSVQDSDCSISCFQQTLKNIKFKSLHEYVAQQHEL